MSDFQEQAKNWLRNVVKQNPDKIKAGVEKAGDLIDKQTGGKYAEKVDAVQQKVGGYVDSQSAETSPAQPPTESTTEASAGGEATAEQQGGDGEARAEEPQASGADAGSASAEGEPGAADDRAEGQTGSEAGGVAEPGGGGDPEAGGGGVVGGDLPDPSTEPASSAGSRPEGTQTGSTVTGQTNGTDSGQTDSTESDEGLPGPRG
ncbi:Rv0909 family putative TA system antitoxin [Kribbella sp. NPDC049174]|uniref:antitoxin n=1 Tax=Kribbella sp. NPDC049174 TaxID=3364112 RepID=UPI00371264D0